MLTKYPEIDSAKGNVLAHLAKKDVGRTFGHLMVACGLEQGRMSENGLPHTRVLDRALQSLRRARKIVFVRNQWRLAESIA